MVNFENWGTAQYKSTRVKEYDFYKLSCILFLMSLAVTATQTDFVFKGACQNIVALVCDLFFLLVIFIYILEWLVVCRSQYIKLFVGLTWNTPFLLSELAYCPEWFSNFL